MARKIGDKLFSEFEHRLGNIAQAQNCIHLKDARGLLVEAARCMIDLIEKPDQPNTGPIIDLLHETGGSKPPQAWCMSFVQSCLAYVERKLDLSSPLLHDPTVMQVWSHTPASQRVQSVPLGGAIAFWQEEENGDLGHTGIIRDCDGNVMHTVEGNAMPSRSIDDGIVREGDGVYPFKRPWNIGQVDSRGLKLIGALKPF